MSMKNVGNICNLSELKIGQVAKIIENKVTNKNIRRHLFDMGFIVGTEVKVKKIAPMGDPIDIELRGYEIAVKKADLKQIEVEVIR